MDGAQPTKAVSAFDVFLAFLRQGLTAFGGPVAHLGYFRKEFVEKRGWLSEAAYADLLALCHFLPGPASSQMGMAIGMRQAGLPGALAAFAGFTLPAATAMIAFAIYAPNLTLLYGDGWIHGLKIAAAAVVLQAVIQMARTLAVGPVRAGMAIGAAIGLVIAQSPMAQVGALIAGGLFGLALLRDAPAEIAPDDAFVTVDRTSAMMALGLFVLLLVGLPILASLLQNPGLGMASVFYRTGSLVFGGGHVMLPLLEREIVDRRWLNQQTFLMGYGVVQAMPGPLFSFAGFVGAAQRYGPGGISGGLIALFSIFLPSLLLVTGVLPFWDRLKREGWARGVLAGVGATVVGLLAAALWDPVLMSTVRRPADWALVVAAFVFLQVAKMPPWLVVIGFAVATGLLLR
ncbi:MAG: chromate efflux transporter [Alphaproteobacteria bacterium]|nr:chromate efflux transporter [Alphaproteobacteria bacterium]MBU1515465.1 chromate efflux transporter [Alphaproteobacteria bacterium]MBU2095463.1 chromate efflux transporter [Alphaproteobacteria bacterium]MBU2150705.1 chromate efflux transporter [Alphaproteobacteria bacterium]MBU2306969.1 chromate efflux transporter [Alphaproteobacteria bacterium]